MLTPVTVLTGFLGSGKTTLLNRLLKSPLLADTAVVINELGEVPIDHALVRESSEQVTVLDSGCICCTVQGDLVRTLRDLHFKRAAGEIPAYKRVIIETTGLADPAPLLHTLIELPLLVARYSLSGVVSTVDAEHGWAQLDRHPEAVKQAAMADRIVITKADRVSPEVLTALQDRLARLNPTARILTATLGEVDAAALLDTALYRADGRHADVARWLGAAAFRPVRPQALTPGVQLRPDAQSANEPSRHEANIRTVALSFEEPLDFSGLLDGLNTLISLRGDQLLRMKGIINAAGSERPRVLHAVQHTLYPDATLPAWPDADRRSRLVFIVQGLEPDFIASTLQYFTAEVSVAH